MEVYQFCMTCGEEYRLEMSKQAVNQYLAEMNVGPVDLTRETVHLPPADCDYCEMYFHEDDNYIEGEFIDDDIDMAFASWLCSTCTEPAYDCDCRKKERGS